MAFALIDPVAGTQPITYGSLPDTTSRMKSGIIVAAYDNYWGGGEFVYGRASGTVGQFGVCVNTPALVSGVYIHTFSAVPNTAGLGRSLFIACTAMTDGQYGWFQIAGLVPVNCQASVAADTVFGIAAAGQGGANSAGKQILNARSILAATTTVAKTGCTNNAGSNVLVVPAGADGWFYGAYLSGTGVAAGATVTDISPDGRQVTMSAVSTASINGTVTAAYNNATVYYNIAQLDRPFAQGAIT